MNKRIFAILANGFEELELIAVVDILKRLDIELTLVALDNELEVLGSHNIKITADNLLDNCDINSYDGVYLAGGMPGSLNLYNSDKVIKIVQQFYDNGKLVSAICAAPMVLSKANILKNRNFTMYPNMETYLQGEIPTTNLIEISDNIITGKGPGAAISLGLVIGKYFGLDTEVEVLKQAMFLN